MLAKTVKAYEGSMPVSGKAIAAAYEWLKQAHVITLKTPLVPISQEQKDIATIEKYGYGLDMPWTVTAIEYEHAGTYDVKVDYTRALSTKRIALCVSINESMTPHLIPSNDEDRSWGSMLVWPLTFFDEKKEWEFAPGVSIIPRYQAKHEIIHAANPLLELSIQLQQKILRKTSKKVAVPEQPMSVSYQPMFKELCEKIGEEHAEKMIRESSLDAVWTALATFTAMGCYNVVVDKEDKTLHCISKQGQRIDLDVFNGQRKLERVGLGIQPIWDQRTSGLSIGMQKNNKQ